MVVNQVSEDVKRMEGAKFQEEIFLGGFTVDRLDNVWSLWYLSLVICPSRKLTVVLEYSKVNLIELWKVLACSIKAFSFFKEPLKRMNMSLIYRSHRRMQDSNPFLRLDSK